MNMKNIKQTIVLLIFLLAPSAASNAASTASKNKEGNRLFSQGKYEDAEKAYLEAGTKDPGRPELLYNLGNSLVKQNKHDQGLQALHQAANKGDKKIQQNSWYNAGNALFAKGDFKDSSQAYIQALRIDPKDGDAKHNLELALRKLKQQEQKKNDKNRQTPQRSGQSQPEQGKNQPDKENKPDSAQQQKQSQPEDKQAAPADSRENSIGKERALQILDALQNQEIENQRKLLERRGRQISTDKDW